METIPRFFWGGLVRIKNIEYRTPNIEGRRVGEPFAGSDLHLSSALPAQWREGCPRRTSKPLF